MNTLTLITEGNRINHHYSVLNVAVDPEGRFTVAMNEDDVDEFLKDFIDGKTGYRMQVDTERFCITVKNKCYTDAKLVSEDGNVVAFIVRVEKITC